MGVNLRNVQDTGEVIPQCDCCGIILCWSIDFEEYLEWKGFWDTWECRDCNKEYKNAYTKYKEQNIPFKTMREKLGL